MKTDIHFSSYLAQLFVERETVQIEPVEKIKTYILCSVTFFFSENRAVYELIRKKNIVQPGRPRDSIKRRMRLAVLDT